MQNSWKEPPEPIWATTESLVFQISLAERAGAISAGMCLLQHMGETAVVQEELPFPPGQQGETVGKDTQWAEAKGSRTGLLKGERGQGIENRKGHGGERGLLCMRRVGQDLGSTWMRRWNETMQTDGAGMRGA